MRVAVGADHAGYRYKDILADQLRAAGHEVLDLGTAGPEPVDYPDFARAVGEAIVRGQAERGLLVCGSAVGVSITANKIPGVRAGVCHDTYSARQGVEHDDMNVLCLGERVIGVALAEEVLRAFIGATFSGAERHRRRLGKIEALERVYLKAPGDIPGEGPENTNDGG